MKTITIEKGEDCWLADFGNDPEMIELFGTGLIPTPYTLHMPAEEVSKRLEAINPGYTVLISAWISA